MQTTNGAVLMLSNLTTLSAQWTLSAVILLEPRRREGVVSTPPVLILFKNMFRSILIIVLILSLSETGFGAAYPLIMEPEQLSKKLPTAESVLRETLARSLREQQAIELAKYINDPNDNISAITAIMLALEEYWQMELSFPPSAKTFWTSEYILEDWTKTDIEIIDIDLLDIHSDKVQIVYAVEPLGLASVRGIPGEDCIASRFCFITYSLFIEKENQWGISLSLNSDAGKSYRNMNLLELLHVNQNNPGYMECILCID